MKLVCRTKPTSPHRIFNRPDLRSVNTKVHVRASSERMHLTRMPLWSTRALKRRGKVSLCLSMYVFVSMCLSVCVSVVKWGQGKFSGGSNKGAFETQSAQNFEYRGNESRQFKQRKDRALNKQILVQSAQAVVIVAA